MIKKNIDFKYSCSHPRAFSHLCQTSLLSLSFQVSDNAKQDLKDGLALYNSENNLGLRNAWNIIQAEVS